MMVLSIRIIRMEFCDDGSTADVQLSVICVFKRYDGDVRWHHYKIPLNGIQEKSLPGTSPRKSYLKVKRHVAKIEDDAKIKLKLYDPSEFHLVNHSRLLDWVIPLDMGDALQPERAMGQWDFGISNQGRRHLLCGLLGKGINTAVISTGETQTWKAGT
ncbi:hypothetical protein LguiA_030930 [Lonicera macranthoides]